jgi:antitoxin ParD1/3/4
VIIEGSPPGGRESRALSTTKQTLRQPTVRQRLHHPRLWEELARVLSTEEDFILSSATGRFPMRTTKQLSITLPIEMAELVALKVQQGQYASESEVLRDGVMALFAPDEAIENWLRTEVAAAYDALPADPSQRVSSADLRRTLAEAAARLSSLSQSAA